MGTELPSDSLDICMLPAPFLGEEIGEALLHRQSSWIWLGHTFPGSGWAIELFCTRWFDKVTPNYNVSLMRDVQRTCSSTSVKKITKIKSWVWLSMPAKLVPRWQRSRPALALKQVWGPTTAIWYSQTRQMTNKYWRISHSEVPCLLL